MASDSKPNPPNAIPLPQNPSLKLFTISPSRLFLIALLILLLLLLAFFANPLRALYHQGQAGQLLAQVVPVGENDYGGFACLRP
jgi:hypothetical protein